MSTIQRQLRSDVAGNPGTLRQGQLAYSSFGGAGGNRLYIGMGTETAGDAANHVVIGGKFFTDMLDHTAGVLTASSALIVDASSKLDHLIVDNIDFNGNTINATTGNLTLNATGFIDASSNLISNVTDPSDPQDAATKQYVDTATGSAPVISTAGDTGTGSVSLADSDFSVTGLTGITTAASGTGITIDLDDTAVTPAAYGSSTAIPIITVDQQGRITAATTASISSTLSLAGDTGTDDVTVGTDTLTFVGTNPVQTAITNNQLAISVDDATTAAKGIASFATADFAVASGAVTIKASGVSNTQLAGSIANAKLLNSSITVGSTAVSLGGTITALAAMTSIAVDNITLNGNDISTTNANGDLTLSPNGTGTVTVPAAYKDRAGFTSNSLVTKEYVDATTAGLYVKTSVRVASTANVILASGLENGDTIDGVTLATNDRVLLKNQTDASENGIYVAVASGTASRSTDADTAAELTGGTFTFVEEGTVNADQGFVFTHDGEPTLETTNLPVAQFSGAGSFTDGAALLKTGNTLDVRVDNSSIEVASDLLQVKALGVTNAMLAGSIANAKLTNSAITINGNATSLGGTVTLDTSDFAEVTNLWFTDERVDDRVAALMLAGEGIDLVYDDGAGSLTVSAELATVLNPGVASFDSDQMTVTSGFVTIYNINGGTY